MRFVPAEQMTAIKRLHVSFRITSQNMGKCQCGKSIPSFGLQGDARPRWCLKCPSKPREALNIVSRKCVCGKKQPLFGIPGDPRARWCKVCPSRPEEAVNIVGPKCFCGKARPVFGLLGSSQAQWCKTCKPQEAVDIESRKCVCGLSQPTFGLSGDLRPRWCGRGCPTKPKEAVNIAQKRCPCGKAQPSFGLPADRKRRWCVNCPDKPTEAVNIRSRKCACGKTTPYFGMQGDPQAQWCKTCKPHEAVNIVTQKCLCGAAPATFGLPGDRHHRWCRRGCHSKPKEAVNIVKRMCLCGKAFPTFGLPGDNKRVWCASCPGRPKEAFIIVMKRCASEWCWTIVCNDKYRGYCLHCFAHVFPDEPVSRNYKVKEAAIRDAVEEMMQRDCPHLAVTFDRQVNGGCSRKRPDTFIDALTHGVFGEVDEEQHNTTEYCSCENKRMMSLMEDIGMRPIVFIRLNPDAFTDATGKKHKSCFAISKSGKLVVSDKAALQARVDVYLSRIRYHLENVPSVEVQVEHLFYDGFAL